MQRSLLTEACSNRRLIVRNHNRKQCAEALRRRQLLKPTQWVELQSGRIVRRSAADPALIRGDIYKPTPAGKLAIGVASLVGAKVDDHID